TPARAPCVIHPPEQRERPRKAKLGEAELQVGVTLHRAAQNDAREVRLRHLSGHGAALAVALGEAARGDRASLKDVLDARDVRPDRQAMLYRGLIDRVV